jgi:hypothetical protein
MRLAVLEADFKSAYLALAWPSSVVRLLRLSFGCGFPLDSFPAKLLSLAFVFSPRAWTLAGHPKTSGARPRLGACRLVSLVSFRDPPL